MNIDFKQYQNLIRKQAWRHAKVWNLVHMYEDIEAQGYEIFTEALMLFEADRKLAFSTFLWHRLGKLNDFCKKERRLSWRGGDNAFSNAGMGEEKLNDLEEELLDNNFQLFLEALERTDAMVRALSQDALTLVQYLNSNCWRQPASEKMPTFSMIDREFRSQFSWIPSRIERTWNEVKYWWKTSGRFLSEAS